MEDERIRLSKLMAGRGMASRRKAEEWIAAGRVTVNGEKVSGVVLVSPVHDVVLVDGKPLPRQADRVVFVMNKPRGYLTGRNDPEGRKTVFDLLEGLKTRVEPIGRLDLDTEGILLLTNDGELAHRLTHPSQKIPKRYVAKVYRTPDERDLEMIRKGRVYLEDGPCLPAKVRVLQTTDGSNAWVEITVTEGRNRMVRRLFAQLGHPVSKLRRESFATISVRGLERGEVRLLTVNEYRRLEELGQGKRASSAGRPKGKGFAKAKPKRRRPGKSRSKRS
jgi:23S rRNA pseudouridine2605 synthase